MKIQFKYVLDAKLKLSGNVCQLYVYEIVLMFYTRR